MNMATMYLSGDAQLWWRSKYDDVQNNTWRCTIDTWEDLKRELKAQFFPENVEYTARRSNMNLKHTGGVCKEVLGVDARHPRHVGER